MKTTISSKGQIVLPAEFRQMDRIQPGQQFDIERIDFGKTGVRVIDPFLG
jgi:AbrB family looped-hinge helix DNA binding protein